jgi:hypothetical protein
MKSEDLNITVVNNAGNMLKFTEVISENNGRSSTDGFK